MENLKNKLLFVKFRVTEEEKKKIQDKAKELGYDNVSAFILQSIKNSSSVSGIAKITILENWYEELSLLRKSISRFGANLNQLAKYENQLAQNGMYNSSLQEENKRLISECAINLERSSLFLETLHKELRKI